MNSTLLIFTAITTLAKAATFTSLNIDSLELTAIDTANSTTSVVGASTVTTSYSFTNDYDGLGGIDTLSFDIIATYSGTPDGAQISTTPNAINYVIEPGQTITFSLDNLSFSRANGLSSTVVFNGFYEISVGGAVSGDFSSVATGDSYLGLSGTGNAIMLDTFEPSFDLTLDALASGSKVFRRPDANFSLETTIPEPTSATLFGLGTLTLLGHRNRKPRKLTSLTL